MPRLAIANMMIGFVILFLAACAGAFRAFDLTEAFIKDQELLGQWEMVLLNSAHGHTNMFAMIQILFGLTMPWSRLSLRWKQWQTFSITSGAFAMGPLMMIRASMGPEESTHPIAILIGVFLSLSLAAIATHGGGLAAKVWQRHG